MTQGAQIPRGVGPTLQDIEEHGSPVIGWWAQPVSCLSEKSMLADPLDTLLNFSGVAFPSLLREHKKSAILTEWLL